MENTDYKKILEHLDAVVIAADYDNKITYANKYFCSLFNTNCENYAAKISLTFCLKIRIQ